MMKLIPLVIFLTSSAVNAQRFRQEQYPFPPQFQTPNSGIFSTDSSLYLPPESHTTIPYYPVKNVNNLQFPYLPPTGTKAPSMFPTPFPFIISTSLVPNFEEDDEDESNVVRMSTHPSVHQKKNLTEKAPEVPKEKRELRSIPKMVNYQQPIDRNDVRFPFLMPSSTTQSPNNQTPAPKRMIISTETHRNDVAFDQAKAASFQGPQFVNAPGVFISSTTEPAIPILRLSNEMDLDGSFSYEALGADQTHYVQHSRMENMGTDKEEQVVEGSYSYVGDNGQTYTVHYIADSNGFRASGDHLPVAPPVPEIIQRSIQYNLAEEAKKPPHLKSWQDDGRDNEINDSEKHHFAIPPPRNLFTGRTPEAFSYSYSQGSNTQNNIVTSASTQVPVKTVDYTTEQATPKINNGPISPQITFLASQGAHVPSVNSIQNSISRMFTSEKPMPQLINYEAGIKESGQEANKALWRWQYGINANNLAQNQNKDKISRSFGEGDDVIINFSNMTPDQYTKMIHSQFESNPEDVAVSQYSQSLQNNENLDNYFGNEFNNQDNYTPKEYQLQNNNFNNNNDNINNNLKNDNDYFNNNNNFKSNNDNINNNNNFNNPENTENKQQNLSTELNSPYHQSEDWFRKAYGAYNTQFQTTNTPVENRVLTSETKLNLITQKNFVFPTQTITQDYNFEDTYYEPRKIKALNIESTVKPVSNYVNNVASNMIDRNTTSVPIWSSTLAIDNTDSAATPLHPDIMSPVSNLKFTDFIVQESNNDFRPITSSTTETPRSPDLTTTETSAEDIIQNNIFLKNLFKSDKSEHRTDNKITEESKKVVYTKAEAQPKTDKLPKFIQFQPKPANEVKSAKKKPLDVSDILNYVSMKSHFELNKIKPRTTQNNYPELRNEVRFIPIHQQKEEESISNFEQNTNNFRTFNHEQQEELRGIIKNYKVLQRNNNVNKKYDSSELRRDLSPPPLKSLSLPPLGRAGPSMKSYLPPIYV